jgi:hypothetical protein
MYDPLSDSNDHIQCGGPLGNNINSNVMIIGGAGSDTITTDRASSVIGDLGTIKYVDNTMTTGHYDLADANYYNYQRWIKSRLM